MGMKKECSCGYWNKEQEECLYNGSGCAKDRQNKPEVTEECIEEAARALGFRADRIYGSHAYTLSEFKDFIRSLLRR